MASGTSGSETPATPPSSAASHLRPHGRPSCAPTAPNLGLRSSSNSGSVPSSSTRPPRLSSSGFLPFPPLSRSRSSIRVVCIREFKPDRFLCLTREVSVVSILTWVCWILCEDLHLHGDDVYFTVDAASQDGAEQRDSTASSKVLWAILIQKLQCL